MAGVFHLKGLNSIRAIAAISVVGTHIIQGFDLFGLPNMRGLELAGYGVTIFFTLSGFLITYLLLIEKERFSSINISQFYIRRVLRIWPLYFLYLLLTVVVFMIYDQQYLNFNLLFYFLMAANIPFILGIEIPMLGHFWSLGVEEQFYLFWPWVVKKIYKLQIWLWFFILFMGGLKIIGWFIYSRTGNNIPLFAVHITRFHCMAVGALGAVYTYNSNKVFIKIYKHILTQILICIVFCFCAFNSFHLAEIINDEIIAVISVLLIANVSSNPGTFIKIDNRIMNYLGTISFGIYIYHPLIIYLFSKWFNSYLDQFSINFQYIVITCAVLISTIFVAAVSYRYFETPFLKFKEKFTRITSSNK